MKPTLHLTIFLLLLMASSQLVAQKTDRKRHIVFVERTVRAPADSVWAVMAERYGEIANFAPSICSSHYEGGFTKGEVGAERKCELNTKGTQWIHEKVESIDHKSRVLKNKVLAAGNIPLDPDNAFAYYRVKANSDGTTTASYEFHYRTKPAFMGALVKGQFKKQLTDTLIGLEHYVRTGEKIDGGKHGNWKTIRNQYGS